jgi:hypothetical protein
MAFRARLFRIPGPGGWTFAPVPSRFAPPVTEGWGRTPVRAVVDGRAWDTSVWRDRKHGTLLAVPARIRGGKGDGDVVTVELHPRAPRGDRAARRGDEPTARAVREPRTRRHAGGAPRRS